MSLTYHSLKRITGGAPIAGSTLWAASVTPRPRTIGLKSVLTGAAIFENGSEGLRVIPDLYQCRPNGILEVRRFLLRWRREMLKKTERNCKHVNIASDHESEKYSQITNQKNIPKNKRDLVDSKGWYLIYVMESTRGSVWSTTSQAYCNECLMTIQRQRVDRALRLGPVAVKSGGFEEFPMWFCFIDEQKSEASWRLILLPCQVSPCAELDQVNSDPFTVTARGSSYQGWVQDFRLRA